MWDHVRPWGNGQYLDFDEIEGNDDTDGRDAARLEGRIIVSGDDALAVTIVRDLSKAGADIVKLTAADLTVAALVDAGQQRSGGGVRRCRYDAVNLEIALLARKINSTVFRHSCVFVNIESGITSAADLAGKTIGEFGVYGQDSGVWAKGILMDEFGFRPERSRWVVGGLDRPMPPFGFTSHPHPEDVDVAVAPTTRPWARCWRPAKSMPCSVPMCRNASWTDLPGCRACSPIASWWSETILNEPGSSR